MKCLFIHSHRKMLMKICCLLIIIQNSQSNELTNSLINTLKFFKEHNELLDRNLLFGVTIISGQLQIIKQYINEGYDGTIDIINNLANSIFETAFQKNVAGIKFNKIQRKFFSPNLWMFNSAPKNINTTLPWNLLKTKKISKHSLNSLTESQFYRIYEECIIYLIQKNEIPEKCSILIFDYKSNGYITTHQVLFLYISRFLLQNAYSDVNFDEEIQQKCYQVYDEFQNIQKIVSVNITLMDLFIEQIVVCGLENYVEFFQIEFLRLILNEELQKNYMLSAGQNQQIIIPTFVHLQSVRMVALILFLKKFILYASTKETE